MQERNLSNKVALVTGAGSDGIGRRIALAFADAGADIAILHFDQAATVKSLQDNIREKGRRTFAVDADLSDPKAARSAVRSSFEYFTRLDIVVNCAATLKRMPFLDITDDEWDRIHKVNVRGYFCVSQEAAKAMVEQGDGGRIIMISSVNQDHATPHLAHYVASKGGVKMLARAMALELAPHGITVNLIAPGTVLTDINREAFKDDAFRAGKERLIPMDRVATPADIAGAAVYLASKDAAYVTGTTITVDGGLTL